MNARPARRFAAGIATLALAGLGLGAGMTAASAADTITPDQYFAGSFYLVDNATAEDVDPGTQLLWGQGVVAVPTPGDLANALPEPAAPHDGVVQFLAPQGQEGDITKWNAYSPLPLIAGGQWLQDVTPASLLNNGQGTIKGGSAVANAGGNYSIGIAYTTNNNNTLVVGGEYFIHISVTANANPAAATYTWQPVQAQQVGPVDTTTSLTAPATGHEGLSVPITADVTASGSSPTGSLVITGQHGTDPAVTLGSVSGSHLAIAPTNLTAGTWTITASFDGTDGSFNDSSDVATVEVTVLTAEPDEQTVTVDIPEGVLTITTPYTEASPLELGTATFDEINSTFSATADFGSDTDISKAIKILDRRPGDLGFTASVSSTDFTTGAASADEKILASKGSLTDVHATQVPLNALTASDIDPTDIASLSATSQEFAAYPAGKQIGAAWISGTFSLTDVPSSIVGGLYTATLTFTVE